MSPQVSNNGYCNAEFELYFINLKVVLNISICILILMKLAYGQPFCLITIDYLIACHIMIDVYYKGTNVHEKSRSDICHLKFNSEGVSQLNAINRHTEKPAILYNSSKLLILHGDWTSELNFTHPRHRIISNETFYTYMSIYVRSNATDGTKCIGL